MKRHIRKSIFITAVFAFGLANTGCDNYFEDAIPSPNDPSSATPGLMLTSMEVATFATYGGQLARQSAIMVQQMAGTSAGSQSIEIAEYNITELTNENEWNTIYTGAIMNGKLLVQDYGEENPWYAGIAKVIMALNYGIATDLWGDVPFDESGQGSTGNLKPAYNTQQEVLAGIQGLLTEAIADLGQPEESNTVFPGIEDFIHGGDPEAWIKTAYALKARYANRLSEVDPTGSATQALAFLNSADLDGSEDDANMIFGEGNALNQWYAYENQRGGYMRANKTFVDKLQATNDPRIPFLLSKDANGGYSGTPANDVDVTNTSYVGSLLASEDSPIPLISYVETKFIEAEAQLRAGNKTAAATAYNAAVKESLLQTTGAARPAYEAANASETEATITLEKIMTQKWIALFLQVESYSDWRRTGFPALTPNPNGLVNAIPRRLVTPQNERLYNPNAVVVGDLLSPVWWDK